MQPGALWLAAVVVLVAHVAVAAHAVAPWIGDDGPPQHAVRPLAQPKPQVARGIRLAGSGSNVALTRALVAACAGAIGEPAAVVEDSIGSTGGIQAVREGAVDVGLVSRPLWPHEAAAGLTVLPYARVPVVLAAHPAVPDVALRTADVVSLYTGAHKQWRDGQPVVVLQRERGDSGHAAVHRVLPALAAADAAAWQARRFRVLYYDHAMQAALLATPGSVGWFDLAAVRSQGLPLRVLAIDGVTPSPAAVAEQRYPFWKDLAFVLQGPPSPQVARLLACVAGPTGRALLVTHGALPLPEAP